MSADFALFLFSVGNTALGEVMPGEVVSQIDAFSFHWLFDLIKLDSKEDEVVFLTGKEILYLVNGFIVLM